MYRFRTGSKDGCSEQDFNEYGDFLTHCNFQVANIFQDCDNGIILKGRVYVVSSQNVFMDSIESAMSMHLRFDYNESVFRWLFAVDGQPWVISSLTPAKGSNTLSPFVTLQTRS